MAKWQNNMIGYYPCDLCQIHKDADISQFQKTKHFVHL